MRIRTVKPEFFVHAEIADLEREIGLPIRLAYIGLWWTPRRLGVQILPYDNVDFEAIMDALEGAGFIEKYEVGDNTYGCVPSFPRHQVINNREVDSSIPSKDGTISPPTEDKQPTAKVEIKLPFESVEFGEAWNRWNDHRNDKKKKLTKGTAVMQLKKLEGIGEARAIKMIDHSISHGWMGLFEDQTSIPIPLQRKPQTSDQFSI